MTIGEALVKYLEARGVEVIFGIPGVHTIELYRGLAQSGIRHITARHEQGVGFMADGYARASGQAGTHASDFRCESKRQPRQRPGAPSRAS